MKNKRSLQGAPGSAQKRPAKMSQNFTFGPTPNTTFGALATLELPGQPVRKFTREESAILARALKAVERGGHPIYMSPIASDHDFEARIGDSGIVLTADGCADVALTWSQTRILARVLASFSEAQYALTGIA
jgi:hypothetical protein